MSGHANTATTDTEERVGLHLVRVRQEGLRCRCCHKPLYNRWREIRRQLRHLRHAWQAPSKDGRKNYLRLFSLRVVLWHLLPLRAENGSDREARS